MQFSIKVPASTSNLGPGFDTIGIALDIYNTYNFDIDLQTEAGNFSYTSNLSSRDFPYGKENLVYKAFAKLFELRLQSIPSLKIYLHAEIPSCGGLGSSSTAIVAGLMAANQVIDEVFTEQELLNIATELDGHPDNVSAALYGGCVVCLQSNEQVLYSRINLDENLRFILLLPNFKVATSEARAALPKQVSLKDAIFNLNHSGLLIAALANKNSELLQYCLEDKLHQPYRATLMPGLQDLINTAKASGALGAVISGAGAAVLAVTDREDLCESIANAMQATWLDYEVRAEYLIAKVSESGVFERNLL